MRPITTYIFQLALMLVCMVTLFLMIRLPLMEGRAQHLDLILIYTDPLILYAYASSIVFFVGLYKAFWLLVFLRKGADGTQRAIANAKVIRLCALLLALLIVLAAVYVRINHHPDDDPAGFLALALFCAVGCLAVAAGAWSLAERLRRTGF